MKKTISIACAFFLIITAMASVFPVAVSAEGIVTDEGTMYVSKIAKASGDIWVAPYTNTLILMPPGTTLQGLYQHKLYAVYDEAAQGYVVKEKVASHRSYTKAISGNAFGLCLDYAPATTTGATEARANFVLWNKIRVGDVLTISGIDLANKSGDITGTFGETGFSTNAKINIKTVRQPIEKTAYTGKTIVAMGDSVTSNGGWTEKVADNIGTHIINSGVGGDRTIEGLKRFDNYVKQYDPDIVLVMYAINDVVQYTFNDNTIATYRNDLKTIYNKCKEIGAQVIFMSPNDINTVSLNYSRYNNYGGVDACMKMFVNIMKEVANETGSCFIDNYSVWKGLNINSSADVRKQYLIDTVHPTGLGYDINVETITNYLKDNCEKITGMEFYPSFKLTADAEASYNIDDRTYMRGAAPGATVDSIISAFSTEVEVYNESSVKVSGTTTVKSGFTVKKKGDDSVKPLTIIIIGDVNNDGMITSTDYLMIKNEVYRTAMTELSALAADVNNSGKVTVTDYLMIKRYLSGTFKF